MHEKQQQSFYEHHIQFWNCKSCSQICHKSNNAMCARAFHRFQLGLDFFFLILKQINVYRRLRMRLDFVIAVVTVVAAVFHLVHSTISNRISTPPRCSNETRSFFCLRSPISTYYFICWIFFCFRVFFCRRRGGGEFSRFNFDWFHFRFDTVCWTHACSEQVKGNTKMQTDVVFFPFNKYRWETYYTNKYV